MRLRGRILRASNLAERRLMTALGVDFIKVPKGTNPFIVMRRFARAARCQTPDHLFVRDVIDRSKSWPNPSPAPEPDTSEPVDEETMPRGGTTS